MFEYKHDLIRIFPFLLNDYFQFHYDMYQMN